jgi:hypothetical protein
MFIYSLFSYFMVSGISCSEKLKKWGPLTEWCFLVSRRALGGGGAGTEAICTLEFDFKNYVIKIMS